MPFDTTGNQFNDHDHEIILRLANLYRVVEAVPAERLDLGNWWCGTTGCAIGHACQDFYFRDKGLMLYKGSPAYAASRFLEDEEALGAFFDMDEDSIDHLFQSLSHDGEKAREVFLRRLREYAADRYGVDLKYMQDSLVAV